MESDTTPETFMKYPKIRILGDDENKGILDGFVGIEEKFDGANFRVLITKKDIKHIIYGSRHRELEEEGEKAFTRCILYLKEKLNKHGVEIDCILEKYGSIILFGECVVRHTIGYDFERLPPFIGFDVYEFNTKTFIDREDKVRLFENLGLEPIKQVFSGKVTNKTNLEVPKSEYYNGLAEGIVIKNFATQQFAKIVRDEFKEKNRETFGGSKKFAKDDTEYFISVYCTNARIEKIIFKAVDDGNKLGMELLALIPKQVYTDIWEEECKELYKSNLNLNLKDIRKSVLIRCKNVLIQMITNNAL